MPNDSGHPKEQMIATDRQAPPEPKPNGQDLIRRRFARTSFSEIGPPEPTDWLVEDFLDRGALAQIFGESQSGKSYLAITLALIIARGGTWFGLHVEQGPVLYVASEAGKGLGARVAAYKMHHGLEDADLPFDYIEDAPDLMRIEDADLIIAEAKAFAVDCGMPLALVVFDTLRASMTGDDSSNQDLSIFYGNCQRIMTATGAAGFVVHHTGHAEKKRPRGGSAGPQGVDWNYRCEGLEGIRSLECVKDREHGCQGKQIHFILTAIEVGISKYGKPETKCVVEPVEAPPTRAKAAKARFTGKTAIARDVLINLLATGAGRPAPASIGIPTNAMVIDFEIWRAAYYAHEKDGSTLIATINRAFNRAVTILDTAKEIGRHDGLVWWAGHRDNQDTP